MALLKWPKRSHSTLANDHLWQLLNSLNDIIIVFDKEGRILLVNRYWEQLTGASVDNAIGSMFSDFLHPEDIVSWNNLTHRLADKSGELIWLRVLHANGELRWCEMRIQPMSSQSPFPMSATLCDITPQVREQQVTNASHRSLQSLVNRLPAMLYRSRNNKHWTMEYVSEGCEALTGYTSQSLLNHSQVSLGSMIHPDDATHVWEQVQTSLDQHKPFDLNYRLTQKSGQEIHVIDKGVGLYSSSGMVLGVEGIILQTSF